MQLLEIHALLGTGKKTFPGTYAGHCVSEGLPLTIFNFVSCNKVHISLIISNNSNDDVLTSQDA